MSEVDYRTPVNKRKMHEQTQRPFIVFSLSTNLPTLVGKPKFHS